MTVLSPKGVPTPLAPTRLRPPDSLMAPMPADLLQHHIRASGLYATYAQPIDRESAHEILAARIAAARASSSVAARSAASPTNAGAKELERARREAERQAKAADKRAASAASAARREADAARREADRDARRRDARIEDLGSDLIRGVFGTLFGRSGR